MNSSVYLYVQQSFDNLVNKNVCRLQNWSSSSITPAEMVKVFEAQRLNVTDIGFNGPGELNTGEEV